MKNEQAAPETKGVSVKLLATLDLGPEIEGLAGRQLRMRLVTIEPGVTTDYGPGVGWPEDRHTLHWLENRGATPAVEISVDVVSQQQAGSDTR